MTPSSCGRLPYVLVVTRPPAGKTGLVRQVAVPPGPTSIAGAAMGESMLQTSDRSDRHGPVRPGAASMEILQVHGPVAAPGQRDRAR
jgi:hypothetical protein